MTFDTTSDSFALRRKDVIDGLYLPTVDDLLRGMCFYRGDCKSDIREFCRKLLQRIRHNGSTDFPDIMSAIEDLLFEPSFDGIHALCKSVAKSGLATLFKAEDLSCVAVSMVPASAMRHRLHLSLQS